MSCCPLQNTHEDRCSTMGLSSDHCGLLCLSWKHKPRAASSQMKTRTAHFACQIWPPRLPKSKKPPSSEISCLQAIAGPWARAWQVGNLSFQSAVGRYKKKSGKEALAGLSANSDMILMSKCIPWVVHSWERSSKAGQDSCEDLCLSSRLKSCLPLHTACWQSEHPSASWAGREPVLAPWWQRQTPPRTWGLFIFENQASPCVCTGSIGIAVLPQPRGNDSPAL